MTLWPCHACDAPGIRNLGTQGFCAVHLEQLYAEFDPSVFAFNGKAVQGGRLRPDWGPHYAEVHCNACGAGWVGVVGESCAWCAAAYESLLLHQIDLLLTPPDVQPSEEHRQAALIAWADRLWNGVEAGLIDQATAERALARETARVA